MKSAVESIAPTRVKLVVEVPFDELKPNIDKAYKTIGAQVAIPGFRRGKVPPRIIDQRVGRGAVLQEAVNDALPELYRQAVAETDIRPLGQPEVDISEVPDPAAGGELKFTAEVDVRPTFDLPDLDALQVTVDPVIVSDEDVDRRLDTLRARFGTLTTIDRPVVAGDFVTIDIVASIDDDEVDSATGLSYEVGSATMLQGMDDALIGLSADEEAIFTSPLAGGERAGEEAEVTVTVRAVKERVLPDVDDDFAELASEFDTVAELRDSLSAEAAQVKRVQQGAQARENAISALLATVDFPVPPTMITEEVDRHLESEGRSDDDEHRAEVTAETERTLRGQFMLDAVAEANNVTVGQNELLQFLLTSAQQYGMEANEFVKAVDESGQIPAMVGEVARRKALAIVLERASITDTTGRTLDLDALLGRSPAAAGTDAAAAVDSAGVDLSADSFVDDGSLVVIDPDDAVGVTSR